MSNAKKFSECDFVDSFFLDINNGGGAITFTTPATYSFNLPILLNKQVQYIRVKGISGYQSSAIVGTLKIGCDVLASSDKILASVGLNAAQNINFNTDQILRVITPMSGQLNIYFTSAPSSLAFTGTFSIGIECYA